MKDVQVFWKVLSFLFQKIYSFEKCFIVYVRCGIWRSKIFPLERTFKLLKKSKHTSLLINYKHEYSMSQERSIHNYIIHEFDILWWSKVNAWKSSIFTGENRLIVKNGKIAKVWHIIWFYRFPSLYSKNITSISLLYSLFLKWKQVPDYFDQRQDMNQLTGLTESSRLEAAHLLY